MTTASTHQAPSSPAPAGATAPLARRRAKYRGYEMLLEDAEQIAAGRWVTVGDWSYAQILDHLARAYEASIDGAGQPLAWPLRLIVGFLFKGRLLNKVLPAGYAFPRGTGSQLAPDADVDLETALESLRQACHRCTSESHRALHPLLGNLDRAEWDRFNLRHAELHMSFVVPVGETDTEKPSAVREPVSSHA